MGPLGAAVERLNFPSAGIGRGPDFHPVCFSHVMWNEGSAGQGGRAAWMRTRNRSRAWRAKALAHFKRHSRA